MPPPLLLLLVCAVLLLLLPQPVRAVLPLLGLDVRAGGQPVSSMQLSHALFGPQPPMLHNSPPPQPLTLTYPPDENDFLLCQNASSTTTTTKKNVLLPKHSLLLVPRGECTFQHKVGRAQQLGAAAVVIYGTLVSRYSLNETAAINHTNYEYTADDIVYPGNKYDYDCDHGEAWIPASAVAMDDPTTLPYDAARNDPVLSSFSYNQDAANLCLQNAELNRCASQACLLTGNVSDSDTDGDKKMQACCAWDLSIWLYPDNNYHAPDDQPITIPAAYMTMRQFSDLVALQAEYESGVGIPNGGSPVTVVLYSRWRPYYNVSAVLIWMLGCFVAAVAAHASAGEYHRQTKRVLAKRRRQQQQPPGSNNAQQPRQQQQQQPHAFHPVEDVLELTAAHAAGFVVMASTALLVLFYFKIYGVVKVFYAIGCSTAVTQVIVHPLYTKFADVLYAGKKHRQVVLLESEEFGDITVTDVVTHAVGFSLGLAWLLMAFFVRNAEERVFFWVMQDVFGSCMCIVFLKVIRLNSIRVATILLIVAFVYDIFFVFVTPWIFKGKSVMITVATSGGPPKADALWCEKYPDDADCQGGNPLPMLLAIPKLLDFAGGSSLLGLGDIVLPGLLLSFAARLDAAKQLLGVLGGGRGAQSQSYNDHYVCPASVTEQRCCTVSECCQSILCRGGYFAPLVVAYAVGLASELLLLYRTCSIGFLHDLVLIFLKVFSFCQSC